MNVLSLFTGIGGLDLGVRLAVPEARTVCGVERDEYCRRVLLARMADGHLDPCPLWGDINTFDGFPWRGVVDCIAGGFPCQDISQAGRREGIQHGNRSGLWHEFARVIGEVRPRYVFVENVSALVVRGLDAVLSDLARLGYDAQWTIVSAADVGAPHLRKRLFILAHARHDEPPGGRKPATGLEPRAGRKTWSESAPSCGLLADAPDERGERCGAARRGGDGPAHGHLALADAQCAERRQERLEGGDRGEGLNGSRQSAVESGSGRAALAHAQSRGEEREAGQRSERRAGAGRGSLDVGNTHCSPRTRRLSVGPDRQPVGDAGGAGLLGHPQRQCGQRRGGARDLARPSGEAEGEARQWEWSGDAADDPEPGLPLFPPGPADRAGWERFLEEYPEAQPSVRRDAARIPHRVDRLRALGNSVVPAQAALAWQILWERLM